MDNVKIKPEWNPCTDGRMCGLWHHPKGEDKKEGECVLSDEWDCPVKLYRQLKKVSLKIEVTGDTELGNRIHSVLQMLFPTPGELK